jgi:hypothetical protein
MVQGFGPALPSLVCFQAMTGNYRVLQSKLSPKRNYVGWPSGSVCPNQTTDRTMKPVFAALFWTFLLISACASQAQTATTVNFGDAVAQWSAACGQDYDQFCKGIQPGGGQLAGCLNSKASPACKSATAAFEVNLNARLGAQAKAVEMCRGDMQRFCSNYKKGDARILRCLMRKQNWQAASLPCKNTLEAAGWLDDITVKAQ